MPFSSIFIPLRSVSLITENTGCAGEGALSKNFSWRYRAKQAANSSLMKAESPIHQAKGDIGTEIRTANPRDK